ncbi:MAG: formyltransferase family protein [Cyclobacteriaceae bacterium]|jgi:methionyl-tRNA formyltransferase|nr:formyltransferase family protein [Cytophagales bacterium]MCZ8327591.1 formyltransferase family protein [Cyclobacteriaceae bacterium]
MRIVFIGNVDFSLVMLNVLLEMNIQVVGVITKQFSSFNSDHVDLSAVAQRNGIPFKYVKDINHENNITWIKSLNPEIIFCFGWSSLLKASVLEIAPLGVIGYHPALLPHNRGRHPIIWALALGLKKTGSTFFFMTEAADAGDIISQTEIEITDNDNAGSLYKKLVASAVAQVKVFVPQLHAGVYPRIVQDLKQGNVWRKRSMNDGKIDWRMTNRAVYNLVRSLANPYSGAHIDYKGSVVKINRVQMEEYLADNIEPGKVLLVSDNQLVVKTGEGAVRIMEHTFEDLPVEGDYLL